MEEDEEVQPVRELTTSVSLSYKMGLPNYGSASIFLSLGGITKTTTPDDVEEMLEQGNMAYKVIRKHLRARIPELEHLG